MRENEVKETWKEFGLAFDGFDKGCEDYISLACAFRYIEG
jgi:hypothetical protein